MSPNLSTTVLVAIFLSCVFGLVMIGIWYFRKGPASIKQKRLSRLATPTIKDDQTIVPSKELPSALNLDISGIRDWINRSLISLSSEKLKLKLSSVYWAITDTEFILITIILAILTFLLGWLVFGSFLGGLFLAIITIRAPRFYLDMAISRRQKKFHIQLLDVLVLVKGAVSAGYGFMQSLDLAIKEIPAPASEEFGRVIHETNLGISLEGAFTNLAQRMENEDLQIVITAIIINSQVGGNLSTVLEASINTIRGRMQLMGEIQSLTSYSRYVGYLLTFLPFITGALVFLVSPDYFDTVGTSIITQVIFGMAFFGIIIGNIWIRRIIRIKV
jgi:tight adherence protein B